MRRRRGPPKCRPDLSACSSAQLVSAIHRPRSPSALTARPRAPTRARCWSQAPDRSNMQIQSEPFARSARSRAGLLVLAVLASIVGACAGLVGALFKRNRRRLLLCPKEACSILRRDCPRRACGLVLPWRGAGAVDRIGAISLPSSMPAAVASCLSVSAASFTHELSLWMVAKQCREGNDRVVFGREGARIAA